MLFKITYLYCFIDNLKSFSSKLTIKFTVYENLSKIYIILDVQVNDLPEFIDSQKQQFISWQAHLLWIYE